MVKRMELWALFCGTWILGFSCLFDSLGCAANPQLSHTIVPSLEIRADGNLFLTSKLIGYEITKCLELL